MKKIILPNWINMDSIPEYIREDLIKALDNHLDIAKVIRLRFAKPIEGHYAVEIECITREFDSYMGGVFYNIYTVGVYGCTGLGRVYKEFKGRVTNESVF